MRVLPRRGPRADRRDRPSGADEEGFTTIVAGSISAVPRDRIEGGSDKGHDCRDRLGQTHRAGRSVARGPRRGALRAARRSSSSSRRSRFCSASLLGYWLAGAALRPVEAMRSEAAAISGSEPGRRPPRAGEGRDLPPRGDAERDARAPRARDRARAELRRGREPRAAYAAGAAPGRARARAAQAANGAGTGRGVRSAHGDRTARPSRRGSPRSRAGRRRRLPLRRGPVRADELVDAVREAFRPRADAAGRAIEQKPMRSSSTLTGSAWSRRSATSSTTRSATARARSSRCVEHDGRVELHVRDEGPACPGLPAPRLRALQPC